MTKIEPVTARYRYRSPEGSKGIMEMTAEAAGWLRLAGWFVRKVSA